MVATEPLAQSVDDATLDELISICAVPPASLAEDAEGFARPLDDAPWRYAFGALVRDPAFVRRGFGKVPFKLGERWEFAIGAYTMADVERDCTRMPPQFVASGVRHEGGIYNKPFAPGFTFADVDERMDAATVVLLNAGFLVPKLASVSLAMLEASALPIWLNVYLSKPGLTMSTQLHTDKQDVVLVQTTGRKRWRVYRPPPPERTPTLDPFARGKGTDHMALDDADLLIDTITEPGQVRSTNPHVSTPARPCSTRLHACLPGHPGATALQAYMHTSEMRPRLRACCGRCSTSLLASRTRRTPSCSQSRMRSHHSPPSTSPSASTATSGGESHRQDSKATEDHPIHHPIHHPSP